jgi:hypothetical protein
MDRNSQATKLTEASVSSGARKDKHDTTAGRRRRTKIDGQFAARLIDMLRSPAWCALSLSARRVLDRIEIELADHGGMDNGKLPITYDDFERYGIHRHSIAPAIRECVALGFAEVTEAGRAGNAEWRKPNLFRLTYKPTKNAGPTEEWKRVTAEEAEIIARTARSAKTESQWRKTPFLGGGNRHRKREIHSTESTTTTHGTESATTLDISGRNARKTASAADVDSSVAPKPAARKRRSPSADILTVDVIVDVFQLAAARKWGALAAKYPHYAFVRSLSELDDSNMQSVFRHHLERSGLDDAAVERELRTAFGGARLN